MFYSLRQILVPIEKQDFIEVFESFPVTEEKGFHRMLFLKNWFVHERLSQLVIEVRDQQINHELYFIKSYLKNRS